MPFDGSRSGRPKRDDDRNAAGNAFTLFFVGVCVAILVVAEALIAVIAGVQWLVTGHWHWPQKFS